MNINRLVATLGAVALLAGCSGGGGGSSPAPSNNNFSNTTNSNTTNSSTAAVTTGLAITIDTGALASTSSQRSAQQITSDVTAIQVNINGTVTTLALSTCGTSSPYTCTVAAPVGSDAVYLATATGTGPYTPVGYAVPQTVTVVSGQTTAVSFTLTPLVASLSGSSITPAAGGNLPEDGAAHGVTFAGDALSPNGVVISTPINTVQLFGTVTAATSPTAYTVTGPTQIAGSYTDRDYTFTYNGAQITGDQLAVKASYTVNATAGAVETLFKASPPATTTIFSIPLVRLELPQTNNPAGATLGGATFDATSSWYFIAPTTLLTNGGTTAGVVFNGGATGSFVLNVTATNDTVTPVATGSTCPVSAYTIGTTTTVAGTSTTPITVKPPSTWASGQGASCVLKIVDSTFATLTQSVNIYPTTLSITAQ